MWFVHALNGSLVFFLTGLWFLFPEASHTLPLVGVGVAVGAMLYAMTLLDPSAPWYSLPQKEAILALPEQEQHAIFQQVHGLFYILATTFLTMAAWASVALLGVVPRIGPEQAALVGLVLVMGIEGILVAIWLARFSNKVKQRIRSNEARLSRNERTEAIDIK
ncbi:MAG: hypothetical protein GVY15_06080 [Bacteroidetes bacterium]|jgi:hypothetical protein|nr:hypothetical protein [Bacteroidota bacterium]